MVEVREMLVASVLDTALIVTGPHALACAAKSDGCVAALIVASVAPYDAKGLDWM